ncbi:MAG: CDC27 family protein [Sulfuricurvum sp.]
MLDIHSLEQRWLKYKIKRSFPYLLTLFGTAIVAIAFDHFLYSDKVTTPITLKKEISSVKKQPKANIHEEAMVLEPSMQFIQSIPAPDITVPDATTHTTPLPVISKKEFPVQKHMPSPLPIIKNVQNTLPTPPMPKLIQSNPSNKTTSIKRDSATFNIHEIEERFASNSNPHLGLYIARYHYDNGNYSEAYNYALKTNAINNTIDESWLIFTKSLIKLGRTEQAKKTLQLYISQSNSEEAKNLLNSLNKEGGK